MIALFTYPLTMTPSQTLWLLLPITFSVVAVYKTIRARSVSAIPRDIVVLMLAYILPGLTALALGLWAIQKIGLL